MVPALIISFTRQSLGVQCEIFWEQLESVDESVDDQWYNLAAGFLKRQTGQIVSKDTQVLCKEGGSVYTDLYLHVCENECLMFISHPIYLLKAAVTGHKISYVCLFYSGGM